MAKLLKTLLSKTASIAINVQLLISPMGLSVSTANAQETAWDKASKAVSTLNQGIQLGTQLLNQSTSTAANSQYLVSPVSADGLHQRLANSGCIVLKAKGDSIAIDSICNVDNPNIEDQAMVLQYMETAQLNMTSVDQFLVKGNNKYSQGPACFDRVAQAYQQELKAKLKSLDDLQNAMEAKVKAFKVQGDKLLTAIEGDDAVLNGANGDVTLANHNFLAAFSPADRNRCATFINENEIQESGKSSGLRGLKITMDEQFEGSGDNGSYSPKQILTNQRQIAKDVDSLLENFNSNITGIDSISLDPTELYSGVDLTLLDKENEGISTILNNELKSFDRNLRDKKKQFKGLDSATAELLENIENGTENSSDIAEIYKRNQYNACVAGYVGGSRSFAKSITNYSLTDSANKDRDSILRTTVWENLEDNDIDIDQKIANIASYDNSSQERIRLSQTQELCGKTIYKDATNVSVSSLLSLYKCECEKIYNSKDGGTISQSDTEAQLAGYTKYISNEKSKLATNLATKVKEKVLFCNEDQTTGVGALSCNGALDMGSKNFCLKTATTCAGNVASCGTAIANALDATVVSQVNKAKTYETEMEKLKKELFATLQNAITISQIDSLREDAINQTGSLAITPKDLQMDLVQNKFIEGLDQELKLEDPDAYLELVKADIQNVRESLKQSIRQQFGADVESFEGYASQSGSTQGFLGVVSTAMENANIEKDRWSEVYNQCKASNNIIQAAVNEQNQYQQEQAQRIAQAQANDLKRCEILEYGCEESQYQSLGSNISSITEAMNGSRKNDPYKDLCSSRTAADPEDEVAKLVDGNINQQITKIKSYCRKEKSTTDGFKEKCDIVLATENKVNFCESYDAEDLYEDQNFCVSWEKPKIGAATVKDIIKLGDCDQEIKETDPSDGTSVGMSTYIYSEVLELKGSKAKLKTALKSKIASCKTPNDDFSSLADAAYLYSANKSPEFAGYGESAMKEQCQAIIAASYGSGDKDEGMNNFFSGIQRTLTGSNAVGR